MAKSIEQMEEEEQRLRHRRAIADEEALIREAKRRGIDTDLYRDKSRGGSGMDWDMLRFKIGGKFQQ